MSPIFKRAFSSLHLARSRTFKNIYEFSKNTEYKNFKDFAESLLYFCEKQKEKININDIENFSHLIQTQFSSLDDKQNYKDALSSLIKFIFIIKNLINFSF